MIDFDVHHGNGTQDIFDADPDVLFVSLHQQPLYPGTGAITPIASQTEAQQDDAPKAKKKPKKNTKRPPVNKRPLPIKRRLH